MEKKRKLPLDRNLYPKTCSDACLRIADFIKAATKKAQDIINEIPKRTEIPTISTIEIECKFGIIWDKKYENRLLLPVLSETLVDQQPDFGFKSDMTLEQHAQFNQLLNRLVKPGSQVTYQHKKTVDISCKGNSPFARIRKTYENDTLVQVLCKTPVDSIFIHFPNSPLDCKLSLNIETVLPKDVEIVHEMGKRIKDRLSYFFNGFSIDLTQVKSDQQKTHELEIEICEFDSLKKVMDSPDPTDYQDFLESFLNLSRQFSRRIK